MKDVSGRGRLLVTQDRCSNIYDERILLSTHDEKEPESERVSARGKSESRSRVIEEEEEMNTENITSLSIVRFCSVGEGRDIDVRDCRRYIIYRRRLENTARIGFQDYLSSVKERLHQRR